MTTTAHIDTFAKDRLPTKETWPEFIFGDEVPEYQDVLNAAEVLLKNGFSDRPAIRMGEILWTYDDLDRKSNNVAEALTKHYGLIPGNRVLLRGNNTPMLAALWYGVLKAGGVVVTTMTMLRQKELNAIIGVSEPEIIIIENDLPIDLVKSSEGKADHVLTF